MPPGQSELDERLSFALAEYLKGPTNEESQRGYEGVTGTPVTGVLDSVSIDENSAEVSFKSSFESKVSSASTAALLLLSQVGATVFQFQDLNELELQISGDCDRFWRLREGTCTTVTREEWGL